MSVRLLSRKRRKCTCVGSSASIQGFRLSRQPLDAAHPWPHGLTGDPHHEEVVKMAEKNQGEGKGTMTVQEAGHLGGKEVQHQRDLRDRKEVRGQAYDKPGPPEGTAFGIGAITQALAGMEFPVSKK